MRALLCVMCACAVATVWAGDPPLVLPDATIIWNNGDSIGLGSTGGFFNATRVSMPGQPDQFEVSAIPALSTTPRVTVSDVVLIEGDPENGPGQPWTGTIDGEAVDGKLFVYAVDPTADRFLFHWYAVNSASSVKMDVTVTMSPEVAQGLGDVLTSAASWPFVVICGCKSGSSMAVCAVPPGMSCKSTACPAGYAGRCGWFIFLNPWPWLMPGEPEGQFPEDAIVFPGP